MTSEQFVRKYRYRLGGMVLFGLSEDPKSSALSRTERLMHAPDEIDQMLRVMYEDLRRAVLAELQEQRTQHEAKPPGGPAAKK